MNNSKYCVYLILARIRAQTEILEILLNSEPEPLANLWENLSRNATDNLDDLIEFIELTAARRPKNGDAGSNLQK